MAQTAAKQNDLSEIVTVSTIHLVDLTAEKRSNPDKVDNSIASDPGHPRCTHGSVHHYHDVATF